MYVRALLRDCDIVAYSLAREEGQLADLNGTGKKSFHMTGRTSQPPSDCARRLELAHRGSVYSRRRIGPSRHKAKEVWRSRAWSLLSMVARLVLSV